MARKKRGRSIGTDIGIVIGVIFAVAAVFVFVPLDDFFITTTQEQLEDIDLVIPDAEKLGTQSVLEEAPELFEVSIQDPIEQLLDELSEVGIGEGVTEKFGITTNVILLDSNQEQFLSEGFLAVEPIDPRTTVIIEPELVPRETPVRFFIDTDFASQLTDDGKNYHQFSGFVPVADGNAPVSFQFTRSCGGIVEHNNGCVRVFARNSCDDSDENKCPDYFRSFFGFGKGVNISDWTQERPLKVAFDYSVEGLQRNIQYLARVNGVQFVLPPVATGHFEKDVTDILCTQTAQGVNCQDSVILEFGLNPLNSDKYNGQITFNNAQVFGPSVIKRDAIEVLEQLSIVSAGGQILDLGFIQIGLEGVTVNPDQKTILEGFLEIRLDGETINTSRLSANGRSSMIDNTIPISIEGRPNLAFTLADENFVTGFHDFKVILRDITVNLGEQETTRTFEYHKSFVGYLLDFNFNGDTFVAFNSDNRAIEVFTNDSTLKTCGVTEGLGLPEVKPPVVQVIDQGFTIITTNPDAGKFESDIIEKTDRVYCSLYPNLPRDTDLLIKINEDFFTINSPVSQKNFDVTCDRTGCTSNVGYSEVFG